MSCSCGSGGFQFGRLFKLSEWAIVLPACGNQAEARRTCEISSLTGQHELATEEAGEEGERALAVR